MSPALLGFASAAAVVVAVAEIGAGVASRVPSVGGPLRAATDAFRRAGREGVDPAAEERRRLLAVGALAAFAAGWFVFGPAAGLVAAALAPTIASRLIRSRRMRYCRAVEAGAADIAIALADALSGGHSLRGAVIRASASLSGPPGNELRRVAAELDLGAATDD